MQFRTRHNAADLWLRIGIAPLIMLLVILNKEVYRNVSLIWRKIKVRNLQVVDLLVSFLNPHWSFLSFSFSRLSSRYGSLYLGSWDPHFFVLKKRIVGKVLINLMSEPFLLSRWSPFPFATNLSFLFFLDSTLLFRPELCLPFTLLGGDVSPLNISRCSFTLNPFATLEFIIF